MSSRRGFHARLCALCLAAALALAMGGCTKPAAPDLVQTTATTAVTMTITQTQTAPTATVLPTSADASNQSMPDLGKILLSQTTGCSYSINADGSVDFSYDNGKSTVTLPATPDMNGASFAVCMSPQKTAVAYIPADQLSIQIKYSDDEGQTWNTSAPILPSLDYYSFTGRDFTSFSDFAVGTFLIDFPTADCGYILIGVGREMDSQNTRDMFKTTDGGKTWTYLQSSIESPGWTINDMCFADQNTGYLAAEDVWMFTPRLYRTSDGGVTWTECNLSAPEYYMGNYFTNMKADSSWDGTTVWWELTYRPYFFGDTGYLPVLAEGNPAAASMVFFYTSTDGGVIRTYDASYDALLADYATPKALPGLGAS